MTAPAWLFWSIDPPELATVTKVHRAWRQLREELVVRCEAIPGDDDGDEAAGKLVEAYDSLLGRLLDRAAGLQSANYAELALKASCLTVDLDHTVLSVDGGPLESLLRSIERDALALAETTRAVTWGEERELA